MLHDAEPRFLPRTELSKGFFLEAYYGWTLEGAAPTWKLWCRRRGPFARRLLVSCGATEAELTSALRGRPLRGIASTLWNDFSAPSDERSLATISGHAFEWRRGVLPWFGVGTYLFDLSLDDDALLSRAQPRVRSKVRNTRREGYVTEIGPPSAGEASAFTERYASMAGTRGLSPLDGPALSRMFAEGDAVLARALDPSGVPRTWNVVYLTATHGYYLHGVHDPTASETAGHQLHMDSLAYVRSRGRRWYDLGLVGSADPNEGIHRFKRSLGGEFASSGVERWSGSRLYEKAVPLLKQLRDRVQR